MIQTGNTVISENIAKQLHDRSTRGHSLSTEEKAMLEEWYTLQDTAESQALGMSAGNDNNVATLQRQVDVALTQLTTVTTRIQEIAAENEKLKHEITLLRGQLAQQAPTIQVTA